MGEAPSSSVPLTGTLDPDKIMEFASRNGEHRGIISVQDEKTLQDYLAARNPILLTDDYAPTDILVAPLFRIRAERK